MSSDSDYFAGASACAQLMRRTDWAHTVLGPPGEWPRTLRTLVPIMLASRFAMRILWGEELVLLYNDAYVPVLGPRKHPRAMGRPAQESFRELWDTVGPMFQRVLGGETLSLEDGSLPLDRRGFLEEGPSLLATTMPPCSSTRCLTIDNPSPRPPCWRVIF